MPDVLQDVTAFPTIERLSPKVHRVLGLNPSLFTGPGTNTYLVGMDGAAPLLIDTGSGLPAWMDLLGDHLAACGLSAPRRCLITHAHPDHIGGAVDLHAAYPQMTFHKQPWPGRDERYAVSLEPLGDGDVIRGQGYTLRAIHSPGHAPDHLCFYLDEDRVLFSGDVVLGVGTTVIPLDGGDLGLYLETLRRLSTLDAARIYPGHGPVIDTPREKIAFYLQHRQEREQQILLALETGGKTVEALVRSIYQGYPENLHAAAGQSVLSHLVKLEREGRVCHEKADPPRYALCA